MSPPTGPGCTRFQSVGRVAADRIVWASAPVSNSPSLTPIAPLKPSAPVRASTFASLRATRSGNRIGDRGAGAGRVVEHERAVVNDVALPSEPVFPSPTSNVPAETIVAPVGVVRGCQGQVPEPICAREPVPVIVSAMVTSSLRSKTRAMSSVTPPIPREPGATIVNLQRAGQ